MKKDVYIIGNFDAVHLGHRALIARGVEIANQRDVSLKLITFTPHPMQFFNAENYKAVYSLSQREKLLKHLGVDEVIALPFDIELANTSAEDFVKKILCDRFAAAVVITGSNFCFGKARSGNAQSMMELAQKYGFEYIAHELCEYMHKTVSTSRVKNLLLQGRVLTASKLLSSPYFIEGEVVSGAKIASKELGVPTANIKLSNAQMLPAYGVYLVQVQLQGKKHYGIANLGNKPTFGNAQLLLETHIFDFSADIYGENLVVEFLLFMRPELKFESVDQLKHHIGADIKAAQYLMKNLDKALNQF